MNIGLYRRVSAYNTNKNNKKEKYNIYHLFVVFLCGRLFIACGEWKKISGICVFILTKKNYMLPYYARMSLVLVEYKINIK